MIRFHARAKLHMVQQPTQLHYTTLVGKIGGSIWHAILTQSAYNDIDWCDSNHFLLDWRVMQTYLS